MKIHEVTANRLNQQTQNLNEVVWLLPAIATGARLVIPRALKYFAKNKTVQNKIGNMLKGSKTPARAGVDKATELLSKGIKKGGKTALEHPERIVAAYALWEGVQVFTDVADAISALQDMLSGIGEMGDDIISSVATVMVKYALPLAVIIAIIYALYKAYNYFADDDEENNIKETASAGATSAGAIASVANPISARAKIKRDRTGVPKAPQKKNTDGTAKNALDMSNNLMGGATIRR